MNGNNNNVADVHTQKETITGDEKIPSLRPKEAGISTTDPTASVLREETKLQKEFWECMYKGDLDKFRELQ